jgi:hypothetical protein
MSALDDLNRAAEDARAQVQEARAALAASRDARAGGPARNAREAERQLHALRAAVTDDARILRDRLTGQDPTAARALRVAALSTTGAIAGVAGAVLLGRRTLGRSTERRRVERQALALAQVLASQVASSSRSATATRDRRRGAGGLFVMAALGAAAIVGTAAIKRRRDAPVDPDDLWLPEETVGPA